MAFLVTEQRMDIQIVVILIMFVCLLTPVLKKVIDS
jgi:hypothetical protein